MTAEEALHILQTDAVAQHVLSLPIVARLAYTWRDGSPRVVPMWFHWTGEVLFMGAPPNSPKMKVLTERPQDGCCPGVVGTVRRVSDDGPPVPRGGGRGAIPDGPAADVSRLGSHCDPRSGGPHP